MARDRIRIESQEAEKAARAEQKANSETPMADHMPPLAASLDKRASSSMRQNAVLHMQRTQGNAAVRRMLAQRDAIAGEDGGPIDEQVTNKINSARGNGSALPDNVRSSMEQSFGADFSGVKVHTDSSSDTLNRQLSAKAFTTGSDIFFSSGSYQPGSGDGNKLLAHELTHVVQQSGSPSSSGPLTLGPAGDAYEQEADSASNQVAGQAALPAVQRQMPQEEEAVQAMRIQRQMPEEEDVSVQAKRVQRESSEEEGCENC